MNIILTESSFLKNISIEGDIYLIDSIDSFGVAKGIKLYEYFIRSHKKARIVNKVLFENNFVSNAALHLSLMKLSDKTLFEMVRILEIINDFRDANKNDTIFVYSKYNEYLSDIANLLKATLDDVVIVDIRIKKINNIKLYIKPVLKIIILMLLFFIYRPKNKDINGIFFMYNDHISFKFAIPFLKYKITTFPFFSSGLLFSKILYDSKNYINFKFINPLQFVKGIRRLSNNKKCIVNSNLPNAIKHIYIEKLLELEIDTMMILSLKSKFRKIKYIIGSFDSYPEIDYVTFLLNSIYNIKTICIPHGVNFKYKVNYISYGTNIYTLWSQNHFDRMAEVSFEKSGIKKITGNNVYADTLSSLMHKGRNKTILIIGEYFSEDNFYSSPFNKKTTILLFEIMKKFIQRHSDCKLNIRTRIYDDYFNIASKYISSNISISDTDISIIDSINDSDLVISIFSNALHEALLLEKKVIQVNLLNIENYRDLASDGLVYYADSAEKFEKYLEDWYDDKLYPKIDYKLHLEKYANNGKFNLLKESDIYE